MIWTAVTISLLVCAVRSQETDFFWHLTDIHYDPWYGNPLGISCNEIVQDAGNYGDYECDSPWILVKSSIEAMRSIDDTEPAFILWSGDNPPHVKNSSWSGLVDTEAIIDLTQNITDIIKIVFPNELVLPMLGNHDYYPKNQLPAENNPLYDALFDMWSQWIDTSENEDTFKRGAYYSLIVSDDPKVRAVVLNNNLYYGSNRVTEGQDDPGEQKNWLIDLLNTARQNQEKVYLFYHVPFGKVPEPVDGKGWLVPSQNSFFVNATVEYSDIILGAFSAHAHVDVYKLFFDESGQAVSTMFVPPSVTPWRVPLQSGKTPPHNPGLRRIFFDKSTYELKNYEQYTLDLPAANNGQQSWRRLYSFTEYHDVNDISASSLASLLGEFKNDKDKFQKYYDAVYANTRNADSMECDCNCRSSHLCAIEFVNYDNFEECYEKRSACDVSDGACAIEGMRVIVCVILVFMLFL